MEVFTSLSLTLTFHSYRILFRPFLCVPRPDFCPTLIAHFPEERCPLEPEIGGPVRCPSATSSVTSSYHYFEKFLCTRPWHSLPDIVSGWRCGDLVWSTRHCCRFGDPPAPLPFSKIHPNCLKHWWTVPFTPSHRLVPNSLNMISKFFD